MSLYSVRVKSRSTANPHRDICPFRQRPAPPTMSAWSLIPSAIRGEGWSGGLTSEMRLNETK